MSSNSKTKRIPRATYRFQFHEGFPLSRAQELVPYLHKLGVSHIYASPLFKARPHSTHGYDTCDFNQLNPELGTEAGLEELVKTLREHDMGLVIDIVPNHMGVGGPENRWWWDVLSRGPESPFAKYFDIDWKSPDPRLRGKVLAPVLGDRYHRVLARHELHVEGSLLRYGENAFPINAPSLKAVAASTEELNENPEALDALLEQQHYRLAWYGRGDSELNYRRFFNITSLPGICVEDEQVFNQVLSLAKTWLGRGWLDGLRVDHVDGLRNPGQFLQRLRNLAPNAWIVVEKILELNERLPRSWPIDGTSGYDFLNHVGALFVDPNGEKPLNELYGFFADGSMDYSAMALEKKRLVLRTLLAAEVDHLTDLLFRIAIGMARYRDFTRAELSGAVTELLACFPVYRTYVEAGLPGGSSDTDYIQKAVQQASRAGTNLPPDLFEFLSDLLLAKQHGELEEEFVARFQQVSSATTAKGVEDTTFYCFNRFVALNEVGGNPGCFSIDTENFHDFCRRQQADWPNTMLASSTHDTKRSEDVRARLYLLSEIPRTWRETVARWSAMNQRHHQNGWPDPNAEYLYYQNLVGAWPLTAERTWAYMEKAAHEAKEHTSWSDRNAEYNSALHDFIFATLADAEFVAEVESFVMPLIKPGCINSLAQTLLRLAAPGVPDVYQGTELWDLSLVDPDNRRPVDFELRQELLGRAASLSAEEAWHEWPSGLPKMWLIQRVLNLRAQRPDLFSSAAKYEPIIAEGPACAHAIAFKRGDKLIALVPRLIIGLHGNWSETTLPLPPGKWKNILTDEAVRSEQASISELLAKFPVALLVREDKS